LYNWQAVSDSRKIAPRGWHIPSDDEWSKPEYMAGRWKGDGRYTQRIRQYSLAKPQLGATNEKGFTALPGGICNADGIYESIGFWGFWVERFKSMIQAMPWHFNIFFCRGKLE